VSAVNSLSLEQALSTFHCQFVIAVSGATDGARDTIFIEQCLEVTDGMLFSCTENRADNSQ
jgi:hypothetical protein